MLAQLELENFRSHRHTVLDWRKQINYVAGPNGGGKSSLRMAMRMLFLDRCDVTTGNGQFKDALVMAGTNDYNVTGVLALDGSSLIRTKGGAFGFGAASLTELNAAVAANIGNPVTLGVCLGDPIFELSDESLKGLLLAMAGVELKSAALKEFIKAHIGESFAVVKSDIAALQVADGPEGLVAAEKQFYALRAAANKDKKDQGTTGMGLAKLGPFNFDVEVEAVKGEELRQAAIKLRNEVSTARKASGGDDQQRLANVREKLKVILAEAKKLDPPQDVTKTLSDTIEKCRSKQGERDLMLSKRSHHMAELASVNDQLGKLRDMDEAVCGTCGQPIDAEAAKAKAAELEVEARRLQDISAVEQTAYDEMCTEVDRFGKRIAELERLRDLAGQQSHTEGEIANLEQALGAASDPAALNALADQLEAAEQVLTDWEREVGGKLDAARKKKIADAALEKATVRHKALDVCHELVGKFRTDEVGKKLTDFMGRINKAASIFSMQYELDPETMVVTCGGLLYRSLSESERIRVDTVFRAAVAYSTGIRFLVIDRADVLDAAGRAALVQILLVSGVRALVLAKIDKREDFAPNPNDKIDFYWVEKQDGASQLTRLAG